MSYSEPPPSPDPVPGTAAVQPAVGPELALRIEQYVKLRDKIAEVKARHTQELKPYYEMQAKLEAVFAVSLEHAGSDSVSVRGAGTVYKLIETSTTVADREQFESFVIRNAAWNLASFTPSKVAIREYVAETGRVPPGINMRQRADIGVRRDSKKETLRPPQGE